MRSALVIRHTPYEGIAGFRQPIEARGYAIDRIDVTDSAFADVDFLEPDLLVMMGGPMGVYEVDSHPWITCEINRIALRIAAGRPTLGVCFGAQMIAAAMGARVYPGPVKEVGFAPVTVAEGGQSSPLRHLEGLPVLHWHGDTFEVPGGAEVLARTSNYVQSFRLGDHVLAIQCHPEMGEDPRIEAWLAGAEDYLAEAGTDAATLQADYRRLGPAAVEGGRLLVAEWLAGLAH